MAETTNTMQAAAFTAQGAAKPEAATLPAELFDGTVNVPVMHQAVKAYLANQRQGTHATKGRSQVTGGNQKPWRQKGTGRARQGSTRAPHWPGGGTYGGPKPNRDYSEKLTRKVRQLARKSALNARAAEGDLRVIDALRLEGPKTKAFAGLLATLGLTERKVLVLTDGRHEAAYLSARNLPSVHVMPYAEASTYHILWSDVVLVESGALANAGETDATTEEA